MRLLNDMLYVWSLSLPSENQKVKNIFWSWIWYFWLSTAGTMYLLPLTARWRKGRRGGLWLFTSLWHVCGCFHGDGSKDSWDLSETGTVCWVLLTAGRELNEQNMSVSAWICGRHQQWPPDRCNYYCWQGLLCLPFSLNEWGQVQLHQALALLDYIIKSS